jgi:uncharacterized membrane-anchored protein
MLLFWIAFVLTRPLGTDGPANSTESVAPGLKWEVG